MLQAAREQNLLDRMAAARAADVPAGDEDGGEEGDEDGDKYAFDEDEDD